MIFFIYYYFFIGVHKISTSSWVVKFYFPTFRWHDSHLFQGWCILNKVDVTMLHWQQTHNVTLYIFIYFSVLHTRSWSPARKCPYSICEVFEVHSWEPSHHRLRWLYCPGNVLLQKSYQINPGKQCRPRSDYSFMIWANSADPDQTAYKGSVWSRSALFATPSVVVKSG